jgi:hypothetical protein
MMRNEVFDRSWHQLRPVWNGSLAAQMRKRAERGVRKQPVAAMATA